MYGRCHPHVASALNCLGVLHYHDANSFGADAEKNVSQRRNSDEQSESSSSGSTIDENQDEQRQHPSTHKAMALFQQALAIRLDILGRNHVDVATALNNIEQHLMDPCPT